MSIVTVESVDGLHMYAGGHPSNYSTQSIPLQCHSCGVLNNPFDSQRGHVSPAAGEFVVPPRSVVRLGPEWAAGGAPSPHHPRFYPRPAGYRIGVKTAYILKIIVDASRDNI
jgi:hypothetical protein